MTSKLISPTNATPQFPPPNPPYDEGLAVLLEDEDETAWKKLLQEVSPQFGDPIAAQIANIMHSRMAGKEVGKLIRKMLVDKAIAERIDSSDEGPRPEYSDDEGPEADSDEDSYSEYEPITWAIRDKNITKLKILLNKGTDVNEYDSDIDQTPLDLAIEKGYTEIVGLLLEKGADVNNSLNFACGEGNTEIVGLLLDKGADINKMGEFEEFTPLITAVISKQAKVVQLLLDRGADVNAIDDHGETVLDWAEKNKEKEKEIVELLKKNGAKSFDDVIFEEIQKECLSKLNKKQIARLNKMSDEERKDAIYEIDDDLWDWWVRISKLDNMRV